MPAASQQISVYDRLWTETYGDLQRVGPAHFHARRLARRLLRDLRYESVLDVGSGPGWNLELLSAGRRLAAFTGIDISAQAIRQAQQRGLPGAFFVHDIQAAPLPGCWDLVYAGLMLHQVPDDRAALRNLRQNTGKYLLISTMAGDYERHRELEHRLGAVRNYRRGELEEKLAGANFHIRRVIYWGFPFFSPMGRWLQRISSTGAGQYPWSTRLAARALTGLYYLNSPKRGDLLTILAEV